jgi:hypothetical protein
LTADVSVDPSKVQNTMDNPDAVSVAILPVSSTNGTFSITVSSWSVVGLTLTL